MTTALSPNPLPRRPSNRAGRLLLALMLYGGLVCGLRVLCFKARLNEVFLVPLPAELLLGWALWRRGSFWKGAIARAVGLALGNVLAAYWIIFPAIYHGQPPWPEEMVWLYVLITVQAVVAAVAFCFNRWLFSPRRTSP